MHLFPAHAGSRFKRPDLVVGRRAGRRLKGKPTLDQRLAPEKSTGAVSGSSSGVGAGRGEGERRLMILDHVAYAEDVLIGFIAALYESEL